MKSETQAVKKAILAKLDRLPASKQTEVLDFAEYLATRQRQKGSNSDIYAYSAALVKRKGLKKLPLKKIAAIVHEVRHG
jgi:hypothetical protein